MTDGNLIKNKIQHGFGGLFDTLSIERKLTDAQMECMLCNSEFVVLLQDKFRKFPFFIINLNPFKRKGN